MMMRRTATASTCSTSIGDNNKNDTIQQQQQQHQNQNQNQTRIRLLRQRRRRRSTWTTSSSTTSSSTKTRRRSSNRKSAQPSTPPSRPPSTTPPSIRDESNNGTEDAQTFHSRRSSSTYNHDDDDYYLTGDDDDEEEEEEEMTTTTTLSSTSFHNNNNNNSSDYLGKRRRRRHRHRHHQHRQGRYHNNSSDDNDNDNNNSNNNDSNENDNDDDDDDDSSCDLSSMLMMTMEQQQQQQQQQQLKRRSSFSTTTHDDNGSTTNNTTTTSTTTSSSDNNNNTTDTTTIPTTHNHKIRRSLLHQKIEPTKRSSQIIKNIALELPITRLKTSSKILFGRQNEINIIQECYENLLLLNNNNTNTNTNQQQQQQQKQRQLILISGCSGVGKSALASYLKDVVRKQDGIYAKGKFDYSLNNNKGSRGGGGSGSSGSSGNSNNNNNNNDSSSSSSSSSSQQQQQQPYRAISMACSEICGAILHSSTNSNSNSNSSNNHNHNNKNKKKKDKDNNDDFVFLNLQKNIPRVLGSELQLLIQLIPALEEIVVFEEEEEDDDDETTTTTPTAAAAFAVTGAGAGGGDGDGDGDGVFNAAATAATTTTSTITNIPRPSSSPSLYRSQSSTASSIGNNSSNTAAAENINNNNQQQQQQQVGLLSSIESKHRITYALQRFLRLVTKQYRSLILVIDDLQWSETSSLDLLSKLLSDPELSKMIVIGIYRSNEIYDGHPLSTTIQEWKMNCTERNYSIHEISIGNLKLPAVLSVIKNMLGMVNPEEEEEDTNESNDDDHNNDDNDAESNDNGILSSTAATTSTSSTSSSRIMELAKLCYEKTDGNIFFLRLFLSTLYEKRLLYYNIGTLNWVWNATEIKSTMPATDNIVDLLKTNIINLPVGNIEILKLASCLGSTFSLSLLETVVLVLSDPGDSRRSVMESISVELKNLIKEGYLKVRVGDGGIIQFSHDKIQETSFLLIPPDERISYQYRIGKLLLQTLHDHERDMWIFIIADLLNKGITTTTNPETGITTIAFPDSRSSEDSSGQLGGEEEEEDDDDDENNIMRFEIAILNCQACRKAFALSAFEAAADYASKGIELLSYCGGGKNDIKNDKWTTHYDLTLDLYSMGAEAESYLGNVSKMNQYCDEVLSLKDIPIEDKFQIYHTLFDSIGNSDNRMDEAAKRILELLKYFNVRFPKSKVKIAFSILSNIAKIKYDLRSCWAPDGIEQLQVTTDPIRVELSRLLDKLATAMYVVNDPRMPLVIFKNLRWTQKYGICNYSPTAVVTTAMVVVGVLEDFKGGAIMGKSALRMLDMVESRYLVESRVVACLYSFVFHWSAPLQDMLRPLLHGYEAGLASGDTESASICIRFFVTIRQIIGTSLERVAKDAHTYAIQMKDLGRLPVWTSLSINRQQWLNMMGKGTNKSGNPLILDGESISADELDEMRKNDVFADNEAKRCEDLLCFYFGAHERLAMSVLKSKGADSPFMGSAVNIHHAVSRGVSSFAAYRLTGKRGYLKMGMLMRSKVKSWLEKGCPNVIHLAPFLDAEYEVAIAKGGDISIAIKRFEAAILLSARGGYLLDAAVVSERFGELYLEQLKDEENASFRLCQAIEYYKEADAYGKVDDLEGKYGYLIAKPKEILTTSTIHSEIQQSGCSNYLSQSG